MSMIGSSGVVSDATSPVVFSDTIAPTAISGSYRFGLLAVTIAMILVPMLYLLLIAAVAWFLVWHVTTNTWILSGSGGAQWRFLGYLTPAVVGATLLFFMVKPILARRPHRSDPVQVSDAEQPTLHALIREICRQVRAPLPARVYVDCQVNASASLNGGAFGVFRRDLDLTIGLPLVTGLSVRQLSGVLAHEFGHFAQGGGMRMTTLIRGVNAWLYRVVHERDTWDSTLEEWSKEGDWRVTVPMALASGSVWVSRQALAGVMMVGHGISCYMMRQMEFDADSYEVKIAGSDAFARTFVRLRELSAGSQVAYSQLPQLLEKHAIPADMPQLVAECSRRLPDEVREQVQKVSDERTGTFDTHPSDADRVAAARALATSGALVGGDQPATSLFRDFDGLSATVTRHHYESDLGIELGKMRLLANDEALRGAEDRQRTEAALRDVFASRISITRPLRIALDEAAAGVADINDVGDIRETLARARTAVKESSLSEESYRRFEQLQFRRDLAFCAEQLFLAGVPRIDAKQFQLAEPTLAGAQSTQSWALQEQDKLRAYLDPFDTLVARRISLGVLMLERIRRDDEARALAVAVTALADAIPFVIEARRSLMATAILDEVTPSLETSTHLRERTAGLAAAVERCRIRAFDIVSQTRIPTGELNDPWRRLLIDAPQLPRADFLQRLMELYWACLSQLVRLVVDAEASSDADALTAVRT
jgi:Zn-dependent protease with chaperone function